MKYYQFEDSCQCLCWMMSVENLRLVRVQERLEVMKSEELSYRLALEIEVERKSKLNHATIATENLENSWWVPEDLLFLLADCFFEILDTSEAFFEVILASSK